MFQFSKTQESINHLKQMKIISAITKAEEGSVIVNNNESLIIKAIPVENVIDTTGAGDLFAAGFLYGIANNKSIEESARYASLASSEIISHFGTRPKKHLSSLI